MFNAVLNMLLLELVHSCWVAEEEEGEEKKKCWFVSMEYDKIRIKVFTSFRTVKVFLLSFHCSWFAPFVCPYWSFFYRSGVEDLWFHSIYKTPTKSNPQCLLLAWLHIWQMYVQNNNKRAEKQKKIVMQKRRKVYAHTISGIQKNGKENGNNDDSDDGGTNETQVIKLMFIYTITPNAHTHTNRSATGVWCTHEALTQFSITQLLMSWAVAEARAIVFFTFRWLADWLASSQ